MNDKTGTMVHNALIAYGEWYAQYADNLGHVFTHTPARAAAVKALDGMVKQLCILGANGLDVDSLVTEWDSKRQDMTTR